MRRVKSGLLSALFVLSGVSILCSPAAGVAADITAHGLWDFSYIHGKMGQTDDPNTVQQRIRNQFEITTPDVKGVVQLEIGDTFWGKDGGALGSDGKDVEVRYSYVDWKLPGSEVAVRMGLQPFALPGYVGSAADFPVPGFVNNGSAILDADGAGITLSTALNDNVTATAFWLRAVDGSVPEGIEGKSDDEMDLFAFSLPMKSELGRINPWVMYGFIGKDSFAYPNTGERVLADWGLLPVTAFLGSTGLTGERLVGSQSDKSAVWAGMTADYKGSSPFYAAMDVNYGRVDMGSYDTADGTEMDLKRAGWYVGGLVQYALDFGTPGLQGWYGSGDDSNIENGSEQLPSIAPYWKGTPFSFGNNNYNIDRMVSYSPAGTWGVAAFLKNIPVGEKFQEVNLLVSYLTGTNDSSLPGAVGLGKHAMWTGDPFNLRYFTTKDHLLECSVESQYKIFPNLILYSSLSYIDYNMSEDVWGSDMYKLMPGHEYQFAMNLRYLF